MEALKRRQEAELEKIMERESALAELHKKVLLLLRDPDKDVKTVQSYCDTFRDASSFRRNVGLFLGGKNPVVSACEVAIVQENNFLIGTRDRLYAADGNPAHSASQEWTGMKPWLKGHLKFMQDRLNTYDWIKSETSKEGSNLNRFTKS